MSKSPAPIPVAVGLVQAEQKVTGGFSDMMPDFASQLNECGLFQKVYYPLRPTDAINGQLALHLSARFHSDGALFFKAFFTGLLLYLPAPLVTYTHQYEAEGTMDLVRGSQTLKSYNANVSVKASHKLNAPPDRLEAEGTKAAAKLLEATLIQQLIDDRLFIEKSLKATNTAAR